ncbi:MAG: ABC transporter permease subunit [Alicyclobacillus sp.]|nr:ABC transporter permease subunit [Alicyclobacillus sp.]
MGQYILRRLLNAIPILVVVSIIIFLFLHMIPGDPARIAAGPDATAQEIEFTRVRLGLDKPLYVQYFIFIRNLVTGNLGVSNRTGMSVASEIGQHLWPTVQLTILSIVWAVIIGMVVGVVAALYRSRWPDVVGMVGSVTGISIPDMWLGMILIEFFAVRLGWFPVAGYGGWGHIIMPSFTLGLGVAAVTARFARTSVIEVLEEDYVRTARAKGLPRRKVIWKHALRNALIPVITMTGLQFGFLLGGAVVTETVFNWPGIGQLLVQSVEYRDYPTVQALMMLFSVEFILINLLVDVLYAVVNPRIQLR